MDNDIRRTSPGSTDRPGQTCNLDNQNRNVRQETNFKGLRVLNWNLNTVNSRFQEFSYVMNARSYDVICIQEAGLNEKNHSSYSFPGYRKFFTKKVLAGDTANNKIRLGLLTLVRSHIPAKRVFQKDYQNKFENLCISLKSKTGIIEVQNIYWRHHLESATLIPADANANGLVICGDFNAYHGDWMLSRCQKVNRNGKILADILDNTDLVLVSPIQATTRNGTMIDLCLTSSNLSARTNVTVTPYLSDVHFALEIEIDIPTICPKELFVPKFKFDSADWEAFETQLETNFAGENIFENISPDNLDLAATKMAEIYYQTAEQIIPKTKWHPRPDKAWYWTPDVAEATRKANYWRKAHRQNIVIHNFRQLKKEALDFEAETIRLAKNKAWSNLCSEIILTNNDRKSWLKLRNLRRGGQPFIPHRQISPLEKANEIAKTFAQRTETANLTVRIQECMRSLEPDRINIINEALNRSDSETDIPISNYEIDNAFSKGKDSAPGTDKITYRMTQHSGQIARAAARNLYNASWNLGLVPTHWKIAAQVPIPKPGNKDEHRPISLLTVFDKNLERIAHDRMMSKVRPKLNPNLFGFLRERGTQDGLASLSQQASSIIYKKQGHIRRHTNKCVAVFVDLEKAFELANRNVILAALAKLGVKGKLLRWIQNYLTDRQGFVTLDGFESSTLPFENGTPQGSIISPALFNILINELLNADWPPGVEVYSYADDIVIVCRSPEWASLIPKALNTLSIACEELGLKINAKKNKAMFFSPQGREKPNCPLYVGLEEDRRLIEWTSEFKYLGVIYSNDLSLNKHVLNNIKKARRKINLLKAMACSEYGCDTNTLVRYVSSCILPVLEYGLLVLTCGKLNKVVATQYESIIPRALKIAYGLPYNTRNEAVLLESGLKPLSFRAEQAAMTYYAKIATKSDAHPLKTELVQAQNSVDTYHRRHGCHKLEASNNNRVLKGQLDLDKSLQPWAQRIYILFFNNPVLHKMLLTPKIDIDYAPPVDRPYRHHTTFLIGNLPKAKKDLNDEEKAALVKKYHDFHKREVSSAPISFYTDASVDPNSHKAAFACVTYRLGKEYTPWNILQRIRDYSGSMTTELYAMAAAVALVKCAAQGDLFAHSPNKKFFIGTDSLSGIQALQNTTNPDNRFCILRIHQLLEELEADYNISGTFFWCPSHIGIEGNERADALAGKALTRSKIDVSELPNSLLKSNIKSYIDYTWKNVATISTFYSCVNEKKKKFTFPKAKRRLQVELSWLRHDRYKLCPYRCSNICSICEAPFDTSHYLLTCPGTSPKFIFLKEILSNDEFDLPEETQAGLILAGIPHSKYQEFFEAIEKVPPKCYCPAHPRRAKEPYHLRFMPN